MRWRSGASLFRLSRVGAGLFLSIFLFFPSFGQSFSSKKLYAYYVT